jgi:hypothetical protein
MVRYTNYATVLWRSQMDVRLISENEDGSADVILENLEPRMIQLLLQEGLISLLGKELDRLEKENKIPALLKGKRNEV